MYHVHPYSMYGFLQLITDGRPNKHPRRRKDRKRRECKRTHSKTKYLNNFWIRILERNGFPQVDQFWLHWLHFTLKEGSLKFTKGSPHDWPNFKAISDTCTSSTAQGGGRSFKNKKPIGEVGCCESGMAERSHCWIERCLISLTLSLSFSEYLPTYLSIFYVSIYLSI